MKVESIEECFLWSILQYFWLIGLQNQVLVVFLSGRLRQVLLYLTWFSEENAAKSVLSLFQPLGMS